MDKQSLKNIAQSTEKTRNKLLDVSSRVTGLSETLLNGLTTYELHCLIKAYTKRRK